MKMRYIPWAKAGFERLAKKLPAILIMTRNWLFRYSSFGFSLSRHPRRLE